MPEAQEEVRAQAGLKVGDAVMLGNPTADSIEIVRARVSQVRAEYVQLEAEGQVFIANRSTTLLVKPTSDDRVGWAKLLGTREGARVTLLRIAVPRWELAANRRAERVKVDAPAVAFFVEVLRGKRYGRRTVGMAVNLSKSGTRARFRTPLPPSSLVHLALYTDPDDPVVALAYVMRIVGGTEAGRGGFEVGLNFVRFIRGKQAVEALTGQSVEIPSEDDLPEDVAPAA